MCLLATLAYIAHARALTGPKVAHLEAPYFFWCSDDFGTNFRVAIRGQLPHWARQGTQHGTQLPV